MAVKPNVEPLPIESTFEEEGLDARALITRTDRHGIITFASKAYREMTKYSKEELLGKPHSIVRHPCMPESAFEELWEYILSGREYEGIVKNLRKDGKYYWVIVKVTPIDKEGNITNDPEKITGFLAVRREPPRDCVERMEKIYKQMRKSELLHKKEFGTIKKWEEDWLKRLS